MADSGFDWGSLAGAGASALLGGGIGALGVPLSKMLGLGVSGDITGQTKGGTEAANKFTDLMSSKVVPNYMRSTASSAAGLMGPAAQTVAQQKFDQVGPSVSDLFARNSMNQRAEQGLSNVGSLFSSMKNQAGQNAGRVSEQTMNAIKGSGGPVAALGATSRNLGIGSTSGLGQLFAQGGSMYNQGLQNAANTQANASDVVRKSTLLSSELAKPYAVNYQNPNGMIGAASNAFNNGWRGSEPTMTNALDPFSHLLGNLAGDMGGQTTNKM